MDLALLTDDILANRIDIYLLALCAGEAILALVPYIAWARRRTGGSSIRQLLSLGLLIGYIWLVLCFTVLCRPKGELEQFFPIPFYNYGTGSFNPMWSEMLMNVLMFVPIGFLSAKAFQQLKWYHIPLVGICLSATIEALQWFCKCGSCETNDLINNTIGAVIGYMVLKRVTV